MLVCDPKIDDCVELAPKAVPRPLLPKMDDASVFVAESLDEPPKRLTGGDCATVFTSGEQTFVPCRIESTLDCVDRELEVVVDVTMLDALMASAAVVAAMVLPMLAKENLFGMIFSKVLTINRSTHVAGGA